ncbi:VOC family protein [Shimazuella kribbensis]|uniref:VOC family protein n=1 Tax=Shimazuella kribbensis TaxID=139808 RepID=UPI00048D826D|nr:VOC family protein [Shimazuella kribbensis]
MIKGLYEGHLPVSDLDRSIQFYENLGLEFACRGERRAFLWIEKGKSWLGLWDCEQVKIPYHVSIRHVAFTIELEDMEKTKQWLKEKGIEVVDFYDFEPARQPLVLPHHPQAHAAIYFEDPDGNLLEFIAPIELDVEKYFDMMKLDDWYAERGKRLNISNT